LLFLLGDFEQALRATLINFDANEDPPLRGGSSLERKLIKMRGLHPATQSRGEPSPLRGSVEDTSLPLTISRNSLNITELLRDGLEQSSSDWRASRRLASKINFRSNE
jgi:hypothetical protein